VLVTLAAPPAAGAAPKPATSWRSPPLDGIIQGRPAIVGATVVVATEHDSLYGLSLRDGHVVWGPRHVGEPVPHAVIAELSPSATHCGDIDPLGITSSPAVDTTTSPPRVFAVAEVLPPTGRTPVHELVGVEATTGRLVVGPTPIDPPAMTHPEVEQQRAGLTVAGGTVYVGFGGLYGDCGDYHGFVVAAKEDGSGIAGTFETATAGGGNRAAAVWATAPPPVDTDGSLLVSTGNSFNPPPPPATDHGDAVVRLPPTLAAVTDEFQAPTVQSDGASDLDLGSTAPVLVGDGQVFILGKPHQAYLLDGASLGGADRHTPLASLDACEAYGSNELLGTSVFVACRDGTEQIVIDRTTSPPRLRKGWTSPVSTDGPVTVGAGVVWTVDTSGGVLYGLDPGTGRVVAKHPVRLDASQHFPTAAVGGGWALVEAANRVVAFRVATAAPRPKS
jgi:outer membrane protein assembly factor BamB